MPKLLIENGVDRGKALVINGNGSFFAGRDSAAQVFIADEMASRRHFQIEAKDGTFVIRDLKSSNGTFLNGSLLKKVEELAPNDRIQVGNTIITFQDDQPHPLIGREIGGYAILDRVGRGGMGTVYRALQVSLDRTVALKVLAPHLTQNTNFVNLFIREARAAGALSHPNIVQVYDVGVYEDTYFFSMEYIPDGSVEDLINRSGPIPLAEGLQMIRDAARGLQYAEQVGIIHRDIKPGNLMLAAGRVVKIGDLGISRSTEGTQQVSQKDGVSGSPHYIAPEQARGLDIDSRVDIYSLGVSFFQMLSGKTPFRGKTPREVILKHLKEEPPSIFDSVAGLPTEVGELVHQMMAKNRDERVASAADLLERLEPLLHRYGTRSTPGTTLNWQQGLKWTGVVVAIALLGGGGYLTFQNIEQKRVERRKLEQKNDEALAELRTLLFDEQLEEVEAQLATFDKSLATEEQLSEIESISRDLEELREKRRQADREAEAQAAFESLVETYEDRLPEITPWRKLVEFQREAAEDFRELAREFDQTDVVAVATTRASRLESEADTREQFERDALDSIRRLESQAQGYLNSKQYARAKAELDRFEQEQFADTEAFTLWQDALASLLNQEQLEWEELSRQVSELKSEGKIRDAVLRIRGFADRAGFQSSRAVAKREIEKLEASVASGNGELSGPELASATVQKVWQLWLEQLQVEKGTLFDFKLRTSVSRSLSSCLERHESFLKSWEGIFASLERQNRSIEIEIDLELSNETVENAVITRVKRDQVSYRTGDLETQCRWTDLSLVGRAQLLSLIAKESAQFVFAGLLANRAGLEELARACWAKVEPEHQQAVRDIKTLIELLEEQ